MKTPFLSRRFSFGLVALALAAPGLHAQEGRPEGGRGRGEGGPPPRMMNPIFAALDANGDGVIDEQEIANAPAALKKLDRNGDGKLTEDEVRPAFGGRGGPGGPGGPVNVDEIVVRMLQFDKNGDGKLSKDELPERMMGMMERGDLNKDGFLTRDELVQLARAQAQGQGRGGPGGERGRERRGDGEERR
ncbi:MAG: hypothetical protein HZA93_14235 [Verrucomicrobia bacterium]|nr:hypothetical protein [Verrucomicrobiota bacterium]